MRCGAMRCTINCGAVHYYLRCGVVMSFCGRFWCGFCGLCSLCGLVNTPSDSLPLFQIKHIKRMSRAHLLTKIDRYVLFMVMSLNQGQFSRHHNSWCMMGLQHVKIHGTSLHSIMSKFLTIHVYVYAIQGKKINFLFQRKINWNYSLLFLLMIGNYHTIWCYCYTITYVMKLTWKMTSDIKSFFLGIKLLKRK